MADDTKPTPPPTQARRQITPEELKTRFSYHAPTPQQVQLYDEVRTRFTDLAKYLNEVIPEGREKHVAFTKLEEAQFAANSAIARRS